VRTVLPARTITRRPPGSGPAVLFVCPGQRPIAFFLASSVRSPCPGTGSPRTLDDAVVAHGGPPITMKTILFIDATPGGVSIPERILRRAGYLVHAVRDGRSGLSLAQSRPPDLIFVRRPAGALQGPALYRACKEHPACRWTPILAAIPAGEDPRPEDSPEDPGAVGADETIHLPINPFELLAKARFLIGDEGRRPPPRLALRQDALLETDRAQALGYLVNLSGTGAYVETDAAGTLGPFVRLRFSLPRKGRVLSAEARVIRADVKPGKTEGVALEFLGLDEDARRDLEEFLFLNG